MSITLECISNFWYDRWRNDLSDAFCPLSFSMSNERREIVVRSQVDYRPSVHVWTISLVITLPIVTAHQLIRSRQSSDDEWYLSFFAHLVSLLTLLRCLLCLSVSPTWCRSNKLQCGYTYLNDTPARDYRCRYRCFLIARVMTVSSVTIGLVQMYLRTHTHTRVWPNVKSWVNSHLRTPIAFFSIVSL